MACFFFILFFPPFLLKNRDGVDDLCHETIAPLAIVTMFSSGVPAGP